MLQMPCIGPLARSIEDLRVCLSIIGDQPKSAPVTALDRTSNKLRIAWTDEIDQLPIDPEIRSAIRHAAETLQQNGHCVERKVSPGVLLQSIPQSLAVQVLYRAEP